MSHCSKDMTRLQTKRVVILGLILTVLITCVLYFMRGKSLKKLKLEPWVYVDEEHEGDTKARIILSRGNSSTGNLSRDVSATSYRPVKCGKEDLISMEFATPGELHGSLRIPKIIHQTWRHPQLPAEMEKYVRKWTELNPDYEYWFWTDWGIRNFIVYLYHDYVPLFNKYSLPIQRADAIKYFIMYQYGGIFADLDVEPLRNFDPILDEYSCVLSRERDEHAKIQHPEVFASLGMMISNSIMACHSAHPFFRHVINRLRFNVKVPNVHGKTGHVMFSKALNEYLNGTDACNHGRGSKIKIAPPEVFIQKFDPGIRDKLVEKCTRPNSRDFKMEACIRAHENNFTNTATGYSKDSFAVHHWLSMWKARFKIGHQNIDIRNVVPKVIFPKGGRKASPPKIKGKIFRYPSSNARTP